MVSDDRLNNRLSGICFDRQRYQQILLNIVQNGVKFTATGGIELVVEVELNNGQKMSQTMSNHSKNNGQ
jgi:signal transduction histidine kinase